jgi:hypothetical protein
VDALIIERQRIYPVEDENIPEFDPAIVEVEHRAAQAVVNTAPTTHGGRQALEGAVRRLPGVHAGVSRHGQGSDMLIFKAGQIEIWTAGGEFLCSASRLGAILSLARPLAWLTKWPHDETGPHGPVDEDNDQPVPVKARAGFSVTPSLYARFGVWVTGPDLFTSVGRGNTFLVLRPILIHPCTVRRGDPYRGVSN